MNQKSKEKKKSQKEIFVEAYNKLTKYDIKVTSILVKDIFECVTKSHMVLDDLFVRRCLLSCYDQKVNLRMEIM